MRAFWAGRKFRVPRLWSNQELRRFAPLFRGDVVNVSGFRDEDKEGNHYRDYFKRASSYAITNYKAEARGFQGDLENETFLDLEAPLSRSLHGNYDVVLNHTVLEHVFQLRVAFANLCALSRDAVIVVVPFLQEQHGWYGDYWRFTPQSLSRLFEDEGLTMVYVSANESKRDSIYVFAIGSKVPGQWSAIAQAAGNRVSEVSSWMLGRQLIRGKRLFLGR